MKFGIALTCTVLMGAACQDLSSPLPAGTVNPGTYDTEESALQMARATRYAFMQESFNKNLQVGLMTDELRAGYYGAPLGEYNYSIIQDTRILETNLFSRAGLTGLVIIPSKALYEIRRQARLARSALSAYAPNASPSLQGEMFVYEAIADLMLADLYCSGIPLSAVNFKGDFTYKPGVTTEEVYMTAVGLLDSALILSSDSDRIQYVARVAKGRALVALGQYVVADTVVSAVPNGYRFELPLVFSEVKTWRSRWFEVASVANQDGGNGMPFLTPRDARIKYESYGNNRFSIPQYGPVDSLVLRVGSGLEARLIQAEAALQRDNGTSDTWLTILNTLRTNGTYTVRGVGDTIWKAGTGGVDTLRPLNDPALSPLPAGKTAFDVRLDLVMRERAFWLYLTGRRQGDLRRLVRNYNRRIEETYPMGSYSGGDGQYTTWIDVQMTDDLNPLFTGCIERETNR